MVVRSSSAERTHAIGQAIGRAARAGDVVTLAGPFGAGKTTLVHGIADGLGSSEWQGSPSFALVNEYLPAACGVREALFHLDLYRVAPGDVEGIGIEEYLARDGIVVVEWPAAALEALPGDRLDLELEHEADGRRLTLSPRGPRGRDLAAAATAAAS